MSLENIKHANGEIIHYYEKRIPYYELYHVIRCFLPRIFLLLDSGANEYIVTHYKY